HEPAATGRTGRGRRTEPGEEAGARTGAEARTGDGHTARRPPPPPPPPQTAPSRRGLGGANRGTAAARGESAQRRADAAASRGSPPGHASPGRGRARGLGLEREPPVPTAGREPHGVGGREAGTGRGRAAGKAPRGEGRGRGPAGRRKTPPPWAGRRTPADPRRDPEPQPPPRAPAARRETVPDPPDTTPPGGDNTPRPLAARGKALSRGETDHGGPAGQGPRRGLPSPSPLSRAASPQPRRRGTPCLHLGGRRARRPCEDTPQPRDPRGGGRARSDEPHRRPGGSRPPPGTRGERAHAPHTAAAHTTTAGEPPPPTAAAAVTVARHAARPTPAPRGTAEPGGAGRHLPTPRGPDRPDPKADGRPPPGVFKPPRRDALGTWKGGGGRGARRAPRANRPDVDHRTTASPARGHARAGPGAAGPGPRRRRQATTPTSHARAAGLPGPRPLATRHPPPTHRGPLPAPASPGALPPTHHTGGRGEGAPNGKRGAERAEDATGVGRSERAGEPDRRPREAYGERGWERAPAARRARGGPPGDRAAGPEQRTTDGRKAEADRSRAGGREATGRGGRPPGVGSRHPSTPHGPARRDRRARAARAGAGGGKAVVAGATGRRRVGRGRGRAEHPLPPRGPSGPTSREVAGRSGGKRGTRRRRRHRARGAGRGAPGRGTEGRDRRGRGGAERGESRLPRTRRRPTTLQTPPPHLLARPRLLRPRTPGRPPDRAPRGPARSARLADVCLPLPTSLPIPRRTRVEERLASRAGGGHRAALGTDRAMILPQVHLRKPCYDFYFL
ncbi:basic proline-rich protein-like, partial [Moschus berezovskii]|uniref:basic proline-rich protein-like n=1 Tax=Moschus berezovskii TaxID=68408 RepID=UPI0024443C54